MQRLSTAEPYKDDVVHAEGFKSDPPAGPYRDHINVDDEEYGDAGRGEESFHDEHFELDNDDDDKFMKEHQLDIQRNKSKLWSSIALILGITFVLMLLFDSAGKDGSTTNDATKQPSQPTSTPAPLNNNNNADAAPVVPATTPPERPYTGDNADVVNFYKNIVNSHDMTTLTLVHGSGLCSQIMNLLGQKIYYTQHENRGFIVDDNQYGYRWNDTTTGVLHGFFTPQFPVLKRGEWDTVMRRHFGIPSYNKALQIGTKHAMEKGKMELMWTIFHGYRGNFEREYGTSGVELYKTFVQEACPSFSFNPQAKAKIQELMAQYYIPELRQREESNKVVTAAIHVKRGTTKEDEQHPGKHYVDKLLEVAVGNNTNTNVNITDCFISSDDEVGVTEVAGELLDRKVGCRIHTLTRVSDPGTENQLQYDDFDRTVEFMADLYLMIEATYFVGTFHSNVASVVSLLRACQHPHAPHYAHSYGVDQDDWYYRLH